MPVPIEAAINHLVVHSAHAVTSASVQRIVYAAHVAHMGETEGGLLVSDRFFATAYGPAVPRVVDLLARHKGGAMRDVLRVGALPGCSVAERAAIKAAWGRAKAMSTEALAKATSGPGSGWSRAYERGRVMPISDRHVFEEFMALQEP